jgi:hypothetical protein
MEMNYNESLLLPYNSKPETDIITAAKQEGCSMHRSPKYFIVEIENI